MQFEVGMYGSVQISVTKVYGPMLIALRRGGGGDVQFTKKKHSVTW